MGRTVERLSGLALVGHLTVGPLSLRVPTVGWSVTKSDGPQAPIGFPLVIRPGPPTPIGQRSVEWGVGSDTLPIQFPVPVPEVSGTTGGIHEAGPRAWTLHWPLDRELWKHLQEARPELIILSNSRTLLREGEPFIRALREIREHLGAAPGLWTPRVGLPHRLALLTYLGVDVLDTTEARWKAAGGIHLDPTLGETGATRRVGPAARAPGHDPPAGEDEEASVADAFSREAELVMVASRDGRLRELVEARLSAEPLLSELLRYADRHLGPLLQERTPVVSDGIRTYVLRESQRRPEVERFLSRFIARYRPPSAKEVLVLLPCSKTKPYRNSPSHRKYAAAFDGLPNLARLHVASITSPLGVVPRELEDVYPARHYDIPVTGEWDEEERRRVVVATEHLLTSGRYRRVIGHLDPVEYGFLKAALSRSEVIWTAQDEHTLSPGSLGALRAAVGETLSGCDAVPGGPLAVVRQEMRELAAFQFGREAADRLFADPIRLAGRPWMQRLTDGKSMDLASWREERGLFQLTVAGARRMFDAHPLEVEVGPGVPLTGDLFTPGVQSADPAICEGDAVILARGGELLAVGEAVLPGRVMTQLDHGLAVTVRHRVHPARTAPPTAT